MAYTSEIEKLQRRFEENPDGRAFAPLADAYRKAGELDLALELVQQGLEKHPNYLSAHIVLARCLVAKGDDGEARSAFTHVLDLDPENIIALRGLADIEERGGNPDQALKWLEMLLEVDPMNGDAKEALERIQSGGATEVAPSEAAPAESAAPEPVSEEPGAAVIPPSEVLDEAEPAEAVAAPDVPEDASPAPVPPLEEEAAPSPEPDIVVEPSAVSSPEPEPEPEPAAASPEDIGEEAAAEVDAAEALGIEIEREEPVASIDFDSPSRVVEDLGVEVSRQSDTFGVQKLDDEPVGAAAAEAADDLGLEKFDGSVGFSDLDETRPLDAIDLEREDDVDLSPGEVEVAPVDGLAATQFESGFYGMPQGEEADAEPPVTSGDAEEAAPEPADAEVAMPFEEDAVLETVAASDEADAGMADEEPAPEAALAVEGDDSAVEDAPGGEIELPMIDPDRESSTDQPLPAFGDRQETIDASEEAPEAASEEDVEPEPVMTETMAELYAKQGHVEEAKRIYRALLATHPGDERLQEKLEALSHPVSKRASDGQITVGEMFSALVASRPSVVGSPEDASAPEPDADLELEPLGEATREGSDMISLDHIFGEVVGASGDKAKAKAPDGGVSFDEFFSGGERHSESETPVEEDPDDLDQFHDWLKGLKG